jgi:hypothetical protein
MNNEQLKHIHEGLTMIKVLIDSPQDDSNPELLDRIEDIVKTTRRRVYASRDKIGERIGPEGRYD